MKQLLNRIPKSLRLAAVLALTVLFLLIWWYLTGYPHPTAAGALHLAERRSLYAESELLTTMPSSRWAGQYTEIAFGVTDTHFHAARLGYETFLWRQLYDDGMLSVPLNEGGTLGILPWGTRYVPDEPPYNTLFVYAPDVQAASGRATVQVAYPEEDDRVYTYTGPISLQEQGLYLFPVASTLEGEDPTASQMLERLRKEQLSPIFAYTRGTVRAEVVLYDEQGQELLRLEKTYPPVR